MAELQLRDNNDRPAARPLATTWKPIALDDATIRHLWLGLEHLPVVRHDVFGDDYENFLRVLVESANFFFEVGCNEGIVCFLNASPKLSAWVYPVMFDKKLRGREDVFMEIVSYMVKMLKLRRVHAMITQDCETTIKFLLRCGFRKNAFIRDTVMRGEEILGQYVLNYVER